MVPLFSPNCDLVGWLDPGRNVFDTGQNWVGFLANGQVWSSKTGNWLGAIDGSTIRDTQGKPVAWNPHHPVQGTAKPAVPGRAAKAAQPARPAKPATPARPAKPATPAGGWSSLSFNQWSLL